MQILMVHPHDLFDKSEPWTRRIKCLAGELTKDGHQVKLVYFSLFHVKNKKTDFVDGYEIIPLSRYLSLKVFLENVLKFVDLGKWADIIHFQKCFHWASLPALLAAYLKRKPIHYDWDDWEERIWLESVPNNSFKATIHNSITKVYMNILEKLLPRLVDTVSVPSRELRQLCMKYGVKNGRIFDAPVGADLKEFYPYIPCAAIREKYGLSNRKVVMYLGQLHGGQYVHLFIKAANIVLHRYPETTFMIVGEGFRINNLKRLTFDLKIEDKVIFVGAVSPGEVPKYISPADVCVACFEDNDVTRCKSPLKIAEYLASGKAIVASNVGEVRNMVGGVGLLVEPGSHFQLAEGILKVLNNEKLKSEMGRRARKRAETKYNWPKTAESLLEAYNYLRAEYTEQGMDGLE